MNNRPNLAFIYLILLTIAAAPLLAQHEHHGQPKPGDGPKTDTMEVHGQMQMSSSLSLSLPMNRNGSGTGWQPDSTPMFGAMWHFDDWMVMVHGDLFVRYNSRRQAGRFATGGCAQLAHGRGWGGRCWRRGNKSVNHVESKEKST